MERYELCAEYLDDYGIYSIKINTAIVKKNKLSVLIKDSKKNTLRPNYKLLIIKTSKKILCIIKDYESEKHRYFGRNNFSLDILSLSNYDSKPTDILLCESDIVIIKSIFIELLNEWNNPKSVRQTTAKLE